MVNASDIRNGTRVFGANGGYVGTVEGMEGATIRLADCPFSEGGDCAVPLSWVETAGGFIRLDRSRLEVMEELCVTPGTVPLTLAGDAE